MPLGLIVWQPRPKLQGKNCAAAMNLCREEALTQARSIINFLKEGLGLTGMIKIIR
jgi:hypothetical protein